MGLYPQLSPEPLTPVENPVDLWTNHEVARSHPT